MAKERILCQGDWFLDFDAKYVWESFLEVNYSFSYKILPRAYIEGKDG